MTSVKPDVLWIRMAGSGTGSGHRIERRRTMNMITLCQAHINGERHLILEASAKSPAWNLAEYQSLLSRVRGTHYVFCNYGIMVPGSNKRLNASVRFYTTFNLQDKSRCECGLPWTEHGRPRSKCIPDDMQEAYAAVYRAIIIQAMNLSSTSLSDMAASGESATKSSTASCGTLLRHDQLDSNVNSVESEVFQASQQTKRSPRKTSPRG